MISKVAGESALRDSEKAIDLLFFYASFIDSNDRVGEKTCRYFIDGDRIYTEADFLKHEHYEHVSSQIDGFETRMLSRLGGPMRSKRQ